MAGEEECAKICNTLYLAFIKHVNNTFDHGAPRLCLRCWDEADHVCDTRLLFSAKFFGHKLEKFCNLYLQCFCQALEHFCCWIFFSTFNLSDINFLESCFVT